MIEKLLKFLGMKPKEEWWEKDFPLGNPYPDYVWEDILHPKSFLIPWDKEEVNRIKRELRNRRESYPIHLPSISVEELTEFNIQDWYDTFNKNFKVTQEG